MKQSEEDEAFKELAFELALEPFKERWPDLKIQQNKDKLLGPYYREYTVTWTEDGTTMGFVALHRSILILLKELMDQNVKFTLVQENNFDKLNYTEQEDQT